MPLRAMSSGVNWDRDYRKYLNENEEKNEYSAQVLSSVRGEGRRKGAKCGRESFKVGLLFAQDKLLGVISRVFKLENRCHVA